MEYQEGLVIEPYTYEATTTAISYYTSWPQLSKMSEENPPPITYLKELRDLRLVDSNWNRTWLF